MLSLWFPFLNFLHYQLYPQRQDLTTPSASAFFSPECPLHLLPFSPFLGCPLELSQDSVYQNLPISPAIVLHSPPRLVFSSRLRALKPTAEAACKVAYITGPAITPTIDPAPHAHAQEHSWLCPIWPAWPHRRLCPDTSCTPKFTGPRSPALIMLHQANRPRPIPCLDVAPPT